jgi:transposase InsO family protein
MRASVVVADVFAQDAFGVALAEEQDVVEAVAAERPNQALANRVRLRRSWRREEAPHPETAPCFTMPPENRRRSHDQYSLEEGACSPCQGRDQPAVQSAEPGTWRRAAEHDELVAKQEVLGGDGGARREESRGGGDYVAKEVDHGDPWQTWLHRSSCAAPCILQGRASSFCGAQPRYIIRDRDDKFGRDFDRVAEGVRARVLKTPVRAPRANAVCERFLGSVRCECLDHLLVLDERHLLEVLVEYCRYSTSPVLTKASVSSCRSERRPPPEETGRSSRSRF